MVSAVPEAPQPKRSPNSFNRPVSNLIPTSLHLLNQILKMHSRILDTDIWLVPPNAAERDFDAPIYGLAECKLLLSLKAATATLCAIPLLKALLQHGDLIRSLRNKYLNELRDVLLEDYNKAAWKFAYRPKKTSEKKLLQTARQPS